MESALFSGWYIWIKFHKNRRYLNFLGGGGCRSPILGGYMWPVMPIFELSRAIPVKSHMWKFGLDWLPFKGYHLNFPWGGGLHVTCNAHFRTWPSYSDQKSCVKIWFGLVEPFKSYRVHKHFFFLGGGIETTYQGGLHLTCDTHFQARMSYSSQKSCVKIWFGLVEIGGMLMLRGAEAPYWRQGRHLGSAGGGGATP